MEWLNGSPQNRYSVPNHPDFGGVALILLENPDSPIGEGKKTVLKISRTKILDFKIDWCVIVKIFSAI